MKASAIVGTHPSQDLQASQSQREDVCREGETGQAGISRRNWTGEVGERTGDLIGNTSYCGQPVLKIGAGRGVCILVFARLEESQSAGACVEKRLDESLV